VQHQGGILLVLVLVLALVLLMVLALLQPMWRTMCCN
jgi:hypothetical protein